MDCVSTEKKKVKADFLLCDPNLDADQIRQLLPASIAYQDALDYNYIVNSTLEGKAIPTAKYRLRKMDKEMKSEPSKKVKQGQQIR